MGFATLGCGWNALGMSPANGYAIAVRILLAIAALAIVPLIPRFVPSDADRLEFLGELRLRWTPEQTG